MKNKKFSQCSFFPKDRKGNIPVTVLTIGTVLICCLAFLSFNLSTVNVRNNFAGLGVLEQLNSQIEENYFYGREVGTETPSTNILTAMNYVKEKTLVDRTCECGDNCQKYAELIEKSAGNNGIPNSLLLLSLMMEESDCISTAFSGSSVGLMQINLIHCGNYGLPSNKTECKKQLIENVELNIEVGAKILKDSYNAYGKGKIFNGCSNRGINYTEWDAALRGYNGWGCGYDSKGNPYTAQDYYVDEVNERYEILKNLGNYVERETTTGILWWKKTTISFSAEYLGKP